MDSYPGQPYPPSAEALHALEQPRPQLELALGPQEVEVCPLAFILGPCTCHEAAVLAAASEAAGGVKWIRLSLCTDTYGCALRHDPK